MEEAVTLHGKNPKAGIVTNSKPIMAVEQQKTLTLTRATDQTLDAMIQYFEKNGLDSSIDSTNFNTLKSAFYGFLSTSVDQDGNTGVAHHLSTSVTQWENVEV